MKLIKYIMSAAAATLVLCSCEDMMKTDSGSYLFEENNRLDQASDSLYSAMGILTQLQGVAERYVIFGELRGDLVSVPATAPFSLQEIADFNVTAENQYLSRRDYYAIINNCNYALERMDTEITIHSNRVMMPEYAAIVAMRSWTYFQLGLAFGEAKYYTSPILSVDSSLDEIPTVTLDRLVDILVDDLEPYVAIEMPRWGSVDGFSSEQFFIRPQLLLADLYLYRNNYEQAAELYYDYIDRNNLTITTGYANLWSGATRDWVNGNNVGAYQNEVISRIPFATEPRLYHPDLINMTFNTKPSIVPAVWFTDEMNGRLHYYNQYIDAYNQVGALFEGDLRGYAVYAANKGSMASAFGMFSTDGVEQQALVTKFYNNGSENSAVTNPANPMFDSRTVRLTRSVATCRIPTVYLRYAEAVNRAGKPSLAFAVIKNGLRQKTVNDPLIVNPDELESGERWLDFNSQKYDGNYGTAIRGRGYGIHSNKCDYLIPELATRADSVKWVEEELLYEMAAETCFEGNRFFDLLRVSRHNEDPDAYFADKIARRRGPGTIASKFLK